MKLYHFTSVKNFRLIWQSQSLKFSDSKKTNDLFEKRKVLQVASFGISDEFKRTLNKESFIKHFYNILFDYKQISLTMDYDNGLAGYASPMMWGHYANHSKGVCIELDSDKLSMDSDSIWSSEIKYKKHVPYLNFNKSVFRDDNDIKKFIIRHKDNIFFKKHFHWKHENEFRIISNKELFLKIDGAIGAIYVPNCKGYAFRVVKNMIKGSGVKLKYLFPIPTVDGMKLSCVDVKNG